MGADIITQMLSVMKIRIKKEDSLIVKAFNYFINFIILSLIIGVAALVIWMAIEKLS
jgi:hypothetical protein